MRKEHAESFALAVKEEEKGREIIKKNYEHLAFFPQRCWVPMATSYMQDFIAQKKPETLNSGFFVTFI